MPSASKAMSAHHPLMGRLKESRYSSICGKIKSTINDDGSGSLANQP